MDNLIKLVMEQQENGNITKEQLTKQLIEIFGEGISEIDRWYKVGDGFWIRRTTVSEYLSAQVFHVVDNSFLCYLHVLSIDEYSKKTVDNYNKNVTIFPDGIPSDIRYIYPIAISQDTEKAQEMFLASSLERKNEWLAKMGIKE